MHAVKRLPLLVVVIAITLPQLLADAAAQLKEEAEKQTPEYWAKLRAEERALGYHADADMLGHQDTDVGMWESGE